MTIVPHDHKTRGTGRRRVAGTPVVLGDSLFSSDFYCPLYPGVYRALLRAWQEYRTRGGWQALTFQAPYGTCLRVHPSGPSLCVTRRTQGAPGTLVEQGWGCVRRPMYPHPNHLLGSSLLSRAGATANAVAFLGLAKVWGGRGVHWSCYWLRRAACYIRRDFVRQLVSLWLHEIKHGIWQILQVRALDKSLPPPSLREPFVKDLAAYPGRGGPMNVRARCEF